MSTLPQLAPRYDVIAVLGEGGMGQVFRVKDRETGREVALKRLIVPEGGDAQQARFLFRQEFWAMASLRHPHLVEAIDYGEGPDGVPYMTMAIVEGADLAPGQDEAAVRAWLPRIAAALAFLHGRGFVHGDLKPENVRLGADGAATLMDLGLLAPAGRAGEPIRGTIAYMAPEVIKQGAIDARTDLYALGAVLYHVLAGKPPFAAASPMAVLRAHLDRKPEKLGDKASPAMDAAIQRLLSKEPSARFASANALLEALGLPSPADEQPRLLASPLLGRDAAREAAVGAATGEPRQVRWLVGPPGSGKTRLLGEARAEVQLAGEPTVALHGAGVEAAPYQALLPLFRALAHEAQANQPALAPVLARVLPELPVAPAPALDGVSERLRLAAAVADLARGAWPTAAWLVDAADQLDPASAELLATLQKDAAHWRWLLAGEAAPAGAEAVELGPLSDEAVLAIAREQLGQADLPTGLADRLPALAAGNPGAVEALLSHWLSSGALVRRGGRWQAGADFALPGGLSVAVDARLEALGEDAGRVARAAAILGAAGELRWLSGVAGLPDERFFAALRALVAADVLAADERSYRFVRASQAIALATALPEAERAALHDMAADWYEADLGLAADDAALTLGDALAVAEHRLAGAAPRKALPWVETAVGRAVAQFTLDPAEALVRRALAIADLADAERLTLDRLQANVWRYQGRGKEALGKYTETDLLARLGAADDPALGEEQASYGALLSSAGRYGEAREVLAAAVEAARDAAGAVRAGYYAGRAAYFAGDPDAALALMRDAVEAGRAAHARGEATMVAVALGFYGYFLAAAGRGDEGLAVLAEAVDLAQASGNPVQTNEALSMRGNVCMAEGRPLEAAEAFAAILATCERFDLPYDALMARLNLSAARLELGDAVSALDQASQAADMAARSQRKFPEAYARAVAGRARIQLGELAAGEAEIGAGLAIAREIGNRYLELHAMVPWIDGLLALGRREAAVAAIGEARAIAAAIKNTEHDGPLDRLALRADLQEALRPAASLPELAAAGERIQAYANRMRAAGRSSDLAHALHMQAAWALRCGDIPAGTILVDEGRKLAEEAGLALLVAEFDYVRARLAARATQTASGVTGLIGVALDTFARAGEAAAALGDVKLDLLCKAGALIAQGFTRQTQPLAKQFEAMTSGLAEDDAQAFLDHPDLAEITRAFPTRSLSAPARDVIGLMASFDDTGDMGALLRRAVANMVNFAGAERGFLLLFEDMTVTHRVVYEMSPDDTDAFSASLAYQVLWTEKPLFVEDAQSDGYFAGQASVRALDLRSAVGVPLVVEGRTLGVMMADSQQITSGFGDFHLELLEALAKRVARGIDAARRREEEARRTQLSDMLERLAIETAGCVELDEFMAPVAAEALALAGADRFCLLVGPDLRVAVAFDKDGNALDPAAQAPSQSAVRWVYEHGEALHLHDAMTSETFSAQRSVMALGLRTIHAVPVTHKDKVLGVLYLDDRRVGVEDPHVTAALRRLGMMVGALLTRRGLG